MNLNLGRLFGIDVRIHWSFWLLPLLVILSGGAGPLSIGMHLGLLFAMFGCVVLHEFGHALAARRYGIRTRDVTLYPIGGVANLERISEKPMEELVIAIAGPLVNVAIVGLLFGVLALKAALGPIRIEGDQIAFDSVDLFLGLLMWLNVGMIAFNLIPAFPLDGGRVFRAILAWKMDRLRATRIAVAVGSVLMFGLAILSFLYTGSIWLGMIALFLYFAGQREVAALEFREWMRRERENPHSLHSALEAIFGGSGRAGSDGASVEETFVWDPVHQAWVKKQRREHDTIV